MWIIYRSLFHFPVWFDETLGKAIFFGLPVWFYLFVSQSRSIADTFAPGKLLPGLLVGLALGGVYGFVTALIGHWQTGGAVLAAPLFLADRFWLEFFLALMTGFWETLLFFSFVMVVIQEKYRHWSLMRQVLVVAGIFLIFHLPNTLLRFPGGAAVVTQLLLLGLFALGQALLFHNRRNLYALALSHALWGLALLLHGS